LNLLMPWTVQYLPERETLLVSVSGEFSEAEAHELTGETIRWLKQAGATRILGDCRLMETAPSLAATYWRVQEYAKLGAPRGARLALVASAHPRAVEFLEFYALACANQGYEARLFANPEAAKAWLASNRAS
jgi:hypothetical protein